jgi:hypothetical protein
MDGMIPLDLGLPEGADPWWEIRAEFPDGAGPWPPPWPADVLAVHSARLAVVRLRAAAGSAALARVEGLLPQACRYAWTVRRVGAEDILTGR